MRPAAFTAECVTIGPSRAERVQQILSEARATLQRTRARDELDFRERPAEPPGASGRTRGPAASCARPADPPRQPTEHLDADAWWAAIDARIAQALAVEREAILEELTPVIRSLREMCEALHEQLTEVRWRQLGTQFDSPHAAYREMWANAKQDLAKAEEGDDA